jgi:uncharacterized coiled-coil protein SlyX
MEDSERDMAPGSRGKKELKGRSQRTEPLTIMVFKRSGTVWNGKVSSLLLLVAAVFFVCYIIATLFLTYEYFDLYRAGKERAAEMAELTEALATTQKSLERAEQQIALLGAYIREKREQSIESAAESSDHEPSFPDLIDIAQVKVARENVRLVVTFNLINTQETDEPISGRIFVLARLKGSDHSEVLVYPNSPLKDGFPVNYRQGQRFVIKRFKTVKSRYTLSNPLNEPLILKILVYDDEGTLILTKTVEV